MIQAHHAETDAKAQAALALRERQDAIQASQEALINLRMVTENHAKAIRNGFQTAFAMKNSTSEAVISSLVAQMDEVSAWIQSTHDRRE